MLALLPNAIRTCAVAGAVLLPACGTEKISTPGGGSPQPSPTVVAPLVPTRLFGLPDAPRGTACQAAERHQFDFWVGQWIVQSPGAAGGLPSLVASELGGCAVSELYADGRGRSLNVWDQLTRRWSQHYVFFQGGALFMEGTFERDSMKLQEQLTLPGTATRWVWTSITRDSVKQHMRAVRTDDGTLRAEFDGRYRRAATLPSMGVPTGAQCSAGAFAQMAFLEGKWNVVVGSDATAGVAGVLTVTRKSNGCLLEESMLGTNGYRSLAYASYVPNANLWIRTFADDEGRYVHLRGTQESGRMVLVGDRALLDGSAIKVRVTWEPQSATRVVQRWEVSADAGGTFSEEARYTLVKQ